VHAVITLHRTPVVGGDTDGLARFEVAADPLDLASRDHEDLQRAVKAARASKGACA